MRFTLLATACILLTPCQARALSESKAHFPISPSSAPASSSDLTRERALIEESDAARKVSDYATARAKVAEAVTLLLARPEAEQDAAWLQLLDSGGVSSWAAKDPGTTKRALQKVLEVRLRTLPDDHPDLQRSRMQTAVAIKGLGDLQGARSLEEKALEVFTRTLPDDDPKLQKVRANLALTIGSLGDRRGARVLQEQVLESFSRTLPDDHLDLLIIRSNLASTYKELGDLQRARSLQERILEVCSRTDDHPMLQSAQENLANTISELGDLQRARSLQEKVLEVRSRTLPGDHRSLQDVRANLAIVIRELGDLRGARALQEQVLEVLSRTLPDDHPDLQKARANLAGTLFYFGDVEGARALFEKTIEVLSRTLPDDHPQLQSARMNLAATLKGLGELEGARSLEEKVLEVYTRTLPDDHPELRRIRANLASTLVRSGDIEGARTQGEKVLAIALRTLPEDHPDLQKARTNLAKTIARDVTRSTLERERDRDRCEELIGAVCRAQVHAARAAILGSPAREAEERCTSLARSLDSSLTFAQGCGGLGSLRALESETFVLSETTRGAAIASAAITRMAAQSPKYGELREALRAASDALADLAQKGTTSEEFDRARVDRESVERELAALARELSGGKESAAELDVASLAARLPEREAAVAYRGYRKPSLGAADELDSTGQPAAREAATDCLCAFVVRSSKAGAMNGSGPASSLTLVDLGPLEPIEAAARRWREAICVGHERGLAAADPSADLEQERGEVLRRLAFDPLIPALGDAERVVVVLDDVLHLVPLEALPLDGAEPDAEASRRLVGDRWRIETRATLTELLVDAPAPSGTALVALGGASFNLPAAELSNEEVASIDPDARAEEPAAESVSSSGEMAPVEKSAPAEPSTPSAVAEPIRVATRLSGTPWERGFTTLTHSGDEARGIGALYGEIFGEKRPVLVLEKSKASRAALEALAPKARFVHIATHGWFAPESIRSWSDAEPLDRLSGLGTRRSGADQVKGMSPMLLSGLALAGANLPEDAAGRTPSLVTADEISTFDLSNCELAVLSACDTNVGERRAGQGVASLQKALQMAGARSVITSLWKVPDEATKELMLDFYRRLWVEKKPKGQALWEAKTKLRNAKDESGQPRYSTRDWAAWMLTGDPN